MKKFLSSTLIFCLLAGMLGIYYSKAYASEKIDETIWMDYTTYENGIKEGWISPEITYEDISRSSNIEGLEESLSNNKDFSPMYDSRNYTNIETARANVPILFPGDIIITNGTSSSGITGHAALVLSANEIIHIADKNNFPAVGNRTNFVYKYITKAGGWLKVYRCNTYSAGAKAAIWTDKTYRNKKIPYKITSNLKTTHETYCSKLVFQAYYYGSGKNACREGYPLTGNLIVPYDLPLILSSGDISFKHIGEITHGQRPEVDN